MTKDLGLTEYGRIQAAGYTEKVPSGVEFIVDVEMFGEIVEGKSGMTGENVANVSERRVKSFGPNIDLGAVAGREHHGFGNIVARNQIVEDLYDVIVGDIESLEVFDRNRPLIHSDNNDGHKEDLSQLRRYLIYRPASFSGLNRAKSGKDS